MVGLGNVVQRISLGGGRSGLLGCHLAAFDEAAHSLADLAAAVGF